MSFLKEEKGQATVKKIIVVAATLFVGILVIFSLYEGTVQKSIVNESLGDALNNTITYLTTDNAPIATTGIEVRDPTLPMTECGTAPCYSLVSAATGNISINYTGVDIGATSNTTYIDYTWNRMTGSALTTSKDTYSYMFTGLLFIGLGLLVLGAMYILGMIGGLGGRR
jgi:hypothetical protein